MIIFEITPNIENEHVQPKFEVICHIYFLVEHGRFLTFWWNMVVFSNFGGTWSFFKFLWNLVVFQIVVEHGCFSNFGGTLSFSLFGGAWSFSVLVEHGF